MLSLCLKYHISDTVSSGNGSFKSLQDVRRIQIAKALNDLYNINNLSWNTVKLIISLLNGCLAEAVNNGLIVRNPAEKIGRELKCTDKKPIKREALTEEQQNTFVEYIKKSTTYRRYLLFILLSVCY